MFDASLVNIAGVAFPASRWQMDSLSLGGLKGWKGEGFGGGAPYWRIEFWRHQCIGMQTKTLHC